MFVYLERSYAVLHTLYVMLLTVQRMVDSSKLPVVCRPRRSNSAVQKKTGELDSWRHCRDGSITQSIPVCFFFPFNSLSFHFFFPKRRRADGRTFMALPSRADEAHGKRPDSSVWRRADQASEWCQYKPRSRPLTFSCREDVAGTRHFAGVKVTSLLSFPCQGALDKSWWMFWCNCCCDGSVAVIIPVSAPPPSTLPPPNSCLWVVREKKWLEGIPGCLSEYKWTAFPCYCHNNNYIVWENKINIYQHNYSICS